MSRTRSLRLWEVPRDTRQAVARARADAAALALAIPGHDWDRLLVDLQHSAIDPVRTFASLPVDRQRAVLAMAYYAALRIEATA